MKILISWLVIFLLVCSTFGQTITYDGTTSYQTFIGWQSTAQAGSEVDASDGDEPVYPSPTFGNYDDALIAAAVDLGINSLRVEIQTAWVNATGTDAFFQTPIQPSTASEGQWHYGHLRQMNDIGVPLKAALAAQGETLSIILCVVDFNDSGYEVANTPSEYSFFVVKMVRKFYDTYGYLPDYIESNLEVDDGSNSNWNATKLANNIVQANTDLAADATLGPAGAGNIKWITPSTQLGASAATWYANMKTANASVTALIDLVGYHNYDAMSNAQRNTLRSAAEADGNSPAMLEKIGEEHTNIYNDLIEARAVMWQQFAMAYPSPWADGAGFETGERYFIVNRTTWAVTLENRAKYFRHYFKYIRRNAVMKGVTNSGSTFKGVPFRNTNGTVVIPIQATGSGTVTVQNLPAGTYNRCVTIGNGSSAPTTTNSCEGEAVVSEGGSTTITFSGAGVGTVYNVDFMAASMVCKWFFSKPSGCP